MSLLTLLTAMALALDNSMAGVFGMMWTDVLSLSHASLYFLCEQNNSNKKNKKKVKGFICHTLTQKQKRQFNSQVYYTHLERFYISN